MNFLKISIGPVIGLLITSQICVAKVFVEYGVDENVDACLTNAVVTNLSKGLDGFLAVKDAPNLKAKRIDKLFNNQSLWICEETKDGNWLGIVYDSSGKMDCGVTSPIDKRKPYKGPCSSGWVSKKYVKPLAG